MPNRDEPRRASLGKTASETGIPPDPSVLAGWRPPSTDLVAHSQQALLTRLARQTISYPAFHKGQPVTLTLDWIRGLTLSNDERGDVSIACVAHRPFALLSLTTSSDPALLARATPQKTVVWQYPFARLERTAHTAHPGSVCLDFTRHGGSWVGFRAKRQATWQGARRPALGSWQAERRFLAIPHSSLTPFATPVAAVAPP